MAEVGTDGSMGVMWSTTSLRAADIFRAGITCQLSNGCWECLIDFPSNSEADQVLSTCWMDTLCHGNPGYTAEKILFITLSHC